MNNKLMIAGGLVVAGITVGGLNSETNAMELPNYYVTLRGCTIMSHPSKYSEIITNVDKNELLEIITYSKSGNWAKVKYNGHIGWSMTKYLHVYEDDLESDVTVKAYALNLRSKPSTSTGRVLKTLKKGTPLVILKKSGGWYYVKPIDGVGVRGWVSAKYIG